MSETRRHPDLFMPTEAAAYLAVTEAQLPTLEKDFGLKPNRVGKVTVYWRRDLDRTACLMVGTRPPAELMRPQELRVAQ